MVSVVSYTCGVMCVQYRQLQGPWWSITIHSGLVLCWLCSTAVIRQGGMIHLGGTGYYLHYTIFTSLSLRYITLVVTRAR